MPHDSPLGQWGYVKYELSGSHDQEPPPATFSWRAKPSWWRRILRREGRVDVRVVRWEPAEPIGPYIRFGDPKAASEWSS